MLGRGGGRGRKAEWEKRPSYWAGQKRELNTRRDGKKSHRKRLDSQPGPTRGCFWRFLEDTLGQALKSTTPTEAGEGQTCT